MEINLDMFGTLMKHRIMCYVYITKKKKKLVQVKKSENLVKVVEAK